MRILLTLLATLLSLVVVVPCAFFAVILLAGPHAGLLPRWMESIVLLLGGLAILLLPALVARRTWKRLAPRAR